MVLGQRGPHRIMSTGRLVALWLFVLVTLAGAALFAGLTGLGGVLLGALW